MLLISLCCALLSSSTVSSDSCDVHSLTEIQVVQQQQFREVLSGQKLEGDHLERLNALSVAAALHQFSGLQIKDYGGIGGIKTINVRSMGSQHTGIFYDGLPLGNAQNGQIDLGQLSLDNIESIQVYQGQRSALFQTASDYAHAGTVYLRTRTPIFKSGESHHFRGKAQYGSSDLLRLSGLWEQKLGTRQTLSLHVEGLTASGHYPFRYRRLNYDGSVAYDTTATRQNGDIQSFTAEVNLTGQVEQGHWKVKGYTYQSHRGIPGAIVNNVWRRGERQSDHNTFFQGLWQQDWTPRYSTRLQGKYAHYGTHYVNRDTTQYMADHRFHQQEALLSLTQIWECAEWCSVSASYDYKYNWLDANLPLFTTTHRHQHLAAVAAVAQYQSLRAQVSLLQTWSNDQRQGHRKVVLPFYRGSSPALFLHWQTSTHIALQAFAKKSFRLPTFNDLYYTDMGNAQLRPESAVQYDFGVQYSHLWTSGMDLQLRADIYHNQVKDKIIAYPKGQQVRWTMLNLGKVDINGFDLQLEYSAPLSPSCQAHLSAQYTWQEAIDVTSASDSYYRDQIPYIPHHSGSLSAGLDLGQHWALTYSFTYVGERYSQQENIRYNHLQPWYTSDMNLMFHWGRYKAVAEVLNLLDQQYDVIANYPMPGRNFRMTLCVNL